MKLSSNNVVKLVEEAALYGGAAALTLISTSLAGLSLGPATPLIATGIGLVTSYLYKLLKDNGVKPPAAS